jgi:hypothetical protein
MYPCDKETLFDDWIVGRDHDSACPDETLCRSYDVGSFARDFSHTGPFDDPASCPDD